MPSKAAQVQQATLDGLTSDPTLDRARAALMMLEGIEKTLLDWTARLPSMAREVSAIRAEMESALDGERRAA